MVSQREDQLARGLAAPRQNGTTLLEKAGWGMLGVAVAVWGIACLLLVYGGSSSLTGWNLLAAFVALISGGLLLLVTGGPIERSLTRWRLSHKRAAPSLADRSWEEHWEELMQRLVR